jgi:hypothetical protein
MRRCNECQYYGDEPRAGLINHCFNEEISDEEHDRVRNNGGDNCEGFFNTKDRSKIADKDIDNWY